MIDYSKTQNTLQALQMQFPDLAEFHLKYAMKMYKREKSLCNYLSNLLPF